MWQQQRERVHQRDPRCWCRPLRNEQGQVDLFNGACPVANTAIVASARTSRTRCAVAPVSSPRSSRSCSRTARRSAASAQSTSGQPRDQERDHRWVARRLSRLRLRQSIKALPALRSPTGSRVLTALSPRRDRDLRDHGNRVRLPSRQPPRTRLSTVSGSRPRRLTCRGGDGFADALAAGTVLARWRQARSSAIAFPSCSQVTRTPWAPVFRRYLGGKASTLANRVLSWV